MLNEVNTYLAANSITDIYINYQPSTPVNCTTLYQYASSAPTEDGVVRVPRLQVRVRNTSDATAETTITTIFNLLIKPAGGLLSSQGIRCTALQTPFWLGRSDASDSNVYSEWACNFELREVSTAHVD